MEPIEVLEREEAAVAAERERVLDLLGRKHDRLRTMARAHPENADAYLQQAYGLHLAIGIVSGVKR